MTEVERKEQTHRVSVMRLGRFELRASSVGHWWSGTIRDEDPGSLHTLGVVGGCESEAECFETMRAHLVDLRDALVEVSPLEGEDEETVRRLVEGAGPGDESIARAVATLHTHASGAGTTLAEALGHLLCRVAEGLERPGSWEREHVEALLPELDQ